MKRLDKKVVMNGNFEIAKFMGRSFNSGYITDYQTAGQAPSMAYHRSWSNLMPVLNKLDNISVKNMGYINHERYVSFCEEIDHLVTFYEIQPVYMVVIQFIEWLKNTEKCQKKI